MGMIDIAGLEDGVRQPEPQPKIRMDQLFVRKSMHRGPVQIRSLEPRIAVPPKRGHPRTCGAKNPPNFVILPRGQNHLPPLFGVGLENDGTRHMPIFQGKASLSNLFEDLGVRGADHLSRIAAGDGATGVREPLDQPPVTGEEQEPLRILVQAPYGLDASSKCGVQKLEDRRGPSLGDSRRDHPQGLIHEDEGGEGGANLEPPGLESYRLPVRAE